MTSQRVKPRGLATPGLTIHAMDSHAVEIIEVGPRDGLQSESQVLPTADKVEFVRRLERAGLRRIEVASFVNPKRVPQMADAEGVLAALVDAPKARYIGLVLNRKGFDRARAAGCAGFPASMPQPRPIVPDRSGIRWSPAHGRRAAGRWPPAP